MKENRRHAWVQFSGEGSAMVISPPEGHPLDLIDIGGYAEIMGNATRGRPVERGTLQSYKSRGEIPPPDRKRGDRKKPPVFEDMWFRKTIEDDLRKRRQGLPRTEQAGRE
ncbi:hypothetical protein OG689_44570 [Kitasatospora sp. NBC_00240]|uniref:hypothetical protein n=1 Tax=Kitasatospora sp. NBC_00240 TaxID=2903567 RepID=UPI0022508697|nr:hypothetical protein [Kitasatospora sp. NBC_00240]MCX5216214.1 hypothetical protein [Kitasatospora sp. NBC_00240]